MKNKSPKNRNPIAKNLRVNKPKVIPDKRRKELSKEFKPAIEKFCNLLADLPDDFLDGEEDD